MLSRSSFGTGCLLLVVLTLLGTTFGNPTNDTNTTKLLLSSFAKTKVLSMGVLDQNLLIITKDSLPMVYEVPMTNYANNQINLYGVVPVDLKDKWPVLNGNDNFTKRVLSEEMAESFSIGANKETLVFAFSGDLKNNLETVTFTVKPPSTTYRVFKIYDDAFNFKDANLISSDEPNVIFNLKTIDQGRIYRLNKFAFNNSTGFNREWEYSMCKSSNGNDSVVFNPPSQCSYIDWKIENDGFVYLNRFHLFAKDQVYIFGYPEAGNSSEVGLKVVKLTDFFIHVIPKPTTNGTDFNDNKDITKNNDASISLIISIVAVSVLIVLLVCTIVMKMFFNKKSADVDVLNRDDRNSVSGELDNILQLPTPKESSDNSAADAGPSNPPTDVGTSGNVSPKSAKSVASTSSKV